MTQRVVVITGAAGGIGQTTVALFKREGWYVVGLDRVEAGLVDRFVRADHSRTSDLEDAFDAIRDLGHVDAVVNNAAMHIAGDVVNTNPDDWDEVMATNVRAAYLMTRLAHPFMLRRGGAIVNVSSVHAMATTRGVTAYATSKGALVALTRATALDLASDSIRVNAVLPGAVDTPMLLPGVRTTERGAAIDSMAARTPLGRIGQPDDIAQAILFLADEGRSSFITGQMLVVDGGAMARLSTE